MSEINIYRITKDLARIKKCSELVGGMLGTEFDETLGKVAIPGVMNIKVRNF